MGTRSATLIIDGNETICHIYNQWDGHPHHHGVNLARVCDKLIVNGIASMHKGPDGRIFTPEQQANGMPCLAAQIVASMKKGIGGTYLFAPTKEPIDWVEYVYIVRSNGVGTMPTIECSSQSGEFPFNLWNDGHIFTGTPQQWLKKYANAKE